MSLFTLFFACFVPKSGSRINTTDSNLEVLSLKKPKRKTESIRTPTIVVSYFPVGSNLSRL
ncbi:hypothetical protein AtNW77_Chr4g0286621 [Arabidopsis thaliana]|uniref:Transmembrane protein n=4 Tax=Arabidopsis TaxID=3701 RepID=A0A178V1A2_ARATH|nr:uncharacterized protein AT4G12735 [Arabidopsis thaliana]KAG7615729.1 hypothetical protein ISN45_At04g012790 [Arabidopsis thaliana x Arabidopsis arenosa]KAG7620230.1 hypothetical protein ISN44_As04g012440 [Arabidopsis suecica]AAM63738.1 unknown [Arabidopsis thaliana]AAV84501.1 At4g12735 [Arabidopsis thaliana]ABG25099.1 At4g12735 [Arabidopsis thaliana]|eukprot:NP_974539.1 hypothetical protein AT4G12735 [Arabidopsis thaliana]